jgi:hypothetical protein
VRIDVTADDIRRGRRDDALACPVALALDRATGEPWGVDPKIMIEATYGRMAGTPPEVASFVCDFDAGREVAPFSFDLEVEPCASK